MKKLLGILVTLALLLSLSIAPVYAAGGQNHGGGQGDIQQGDAGSGISPGDDAQDNQVGD
jgi:hypothetical protein